MLLAAQIAAGCSSSPSSEVGSSAPQGAGLELSDLVYHVDETLEPWIDPDTGYDTTREWTMDGETWPVALIMSPSQSPQLLMGEQADTFAHALQPFGITPVVEKIEMPPRTFHALQRSKWPFVYMPYAVFVDYCRTNDNQGGAGGLQYVALAGSTQGAGYTVITQDPGIRTVADLAGKTVAGMENNPARIVLMLAAAKQAGLSVGDGDGDIHLVSGESAADLNDYLDGTYDAVVVLNIVKQRFLRTGSHVVTDFTDVGYIPNYTILCVERSVLEERPDVVDAFLEAHYQANLLAEKTPAPEMNAMLMESWNGYFRSQDTTAASQRIVPDMESFELLMGVMTAEQRIDPDLLGDCFAYLTEHDMWGWGGTVDATRLLALDRYDSVLEAHGEDPQTK